MAERGDEPALIDAVTDRRISYRELITTTHRIASGLARRGFRKGDVFAIICPNVLEYAATLLGVWRAGGVATTMNPLATPDEIAAQLSETGAKFVLTIGPLADKVIAGAGRASVVEVFVLGGAVPGATDFEALLDPDPIPVRVQIDPRVDLAALPWSSGTSGKPKAVMLTHECLMAQCHQYLAVQDHRAGDKTLAVLPFFHIYGLVLILMVALRNGNPLVVLTRFELEAFLAAIAKYRVTLAPLVPPIVVALAKHPAVSGYDLSGLRYVMCGAAPLGGDVEAACADRLGCLVMQGYGMTELSGASHVHPLDPARIKRGSVGFLVPGLEARIVDPESGHDLPDGERGELWLRGPNVMKGYLNRPEATAATLDRDGWLHTGDITYQDPDGYYYVVDRVKELIKYKGHQVAPADLEAVLLTHPSIADAAVIPSPCPDAGEVPKAFIVSKGSLTADQIISYVADRVSPLDKVRRVEFVDAIPKSPSGKILRRILVERERAATTGG
jgi:acyl-CoA synthetase (AMP-forming)/AMP-acid ligase II